MRSRHSQRIDCKAALDKGSVRWIIPASKLRSLGDHGPLGHPSLTRPELERQAPRNSGRSALEFSGSNAVHAGACPLREVRLWCWGAKCEVRDHGWTADGQFQAVLPSSVPPLRAVSTARTEAGAVEDPQSLASARHLREARPGCSAGWSWAVVARAEQASVQVGMCLTYQPNTAAQPLNG